MVTPPRATKFLKSHVAFTRALFPSHHDAWAFVGVTSRFIFRLLAVALLLRALNPEEMAVWYLFGAAFGIAALVEAGLSRAVTRYVAALSSEHKEERSKSFGLGEFLNAASPFYAVVVVIVCMLAFILGAYWFTQHSVDMNQGQNVLAWALYVTAGGFALYALFLSGVLSGLQQVAITSRNDVLGAAVNAALIAILVGALNGVTPAAVALLISSVVVLVLNAFALKRSLDSMRISRTAGLSLNGRLRIVRSMVPDATRMLLMLVSYQCLTSGYIVVLGAYLPMSVVASYGVTAQLIYLVVALSNSWSVAGFPMLAASSGNPAVLRSIFQPRFVRSTVLASIAMTLIASFGPVFMEVIGSKTPLLDRWLITILAATVLIEFVVSQFTYLLLSRGVHSIAAWNAVSAVCSVGLAALLVHFGYSLEVVIGTRLLLFLLVVGLSSLPRGIGLLSGRPA